MNYKETGDKYKEVFKKEYKEYIDSLIKGVKKEKNIIDFSEYTSKTAIKPKEITLNFLNSENIKDHIFSDNVSFSLNYSFYLEFLSHKYRLELDSKLFNEIVNQNRITSKVQ